jgi:hypothetical protein
MGCQSLSYLRIFLQFESKVKSECKLCIFAASHIFIKYITMKEEVVF